jgi:hypothetical protein
LKICFESVPASSQTKQTAIVYRFAEIYLILKINRRGEGRFYITFNRILAKNHILVGQEQRLKEGRLRLELEHTSEKEKKIEGWSMD